MFEITALSTWVSDEKGVAIRINPACYKFFGAKEEEVIGKYNALNDEVIEKQGKMPIVKMAYATGKPVSFLLDYDFGKVDHVSVINATHKYIKVNLTPIVDEEGKVTNVVFQSIDLTDLKEAEKELIKAKERAEESDRLKSAFLANMSHEIRTPMNGILGFSNLLKNPELSGKQQQKYVGIIEKSGARMLGIINDIISISKIESGLMEVNKRDLNINEHIEYIYNFFKPEVEGKSMQLLFRNHLPSKEAIINSDSEKVYAILTNIVKNAIKYSEKGTIEVGYTKKGNYIEFYVKDTGIGIPKDRKEAIFERFIQADIADKNAYQGAGLGLSISKAYVEMLDGKIWVESEEGNGSTFYFTLPYNTKPKKGNASINEILDAQNITSIKKLKILIVEDDETSAELISIIVQEIGKVIINARTGIESIEACKKNPDIDLILMDIQMPEMNGYEATREIRKFNKDVVIIAQTAYALEGDKEKSIAAGCNDYIPKPINQELLFELISKHF